MGGWWHIFRQDLFVLQHSFWASKSATTWIHKLLFLWWPFYYPFYLHCYVSFVRSFNMQMTETWSKAKKAFFADGPLELLHCYFHWIMAFLKSCNAPHASTRDVADFATLWCFQLLVAEVSMSDWGRQGWKLTVLTSRWASPKIGAR